MYYVVTYVKKSKKKSMLCPTSPHPGLRGATMGNLICFESKTCPVGGVFEFRKCACAVVTCSYTEIYVASLIPGSPIPGKRRDVDGWLCFACSGAVLFRFS